MFAGVEECERNLKCPFDLPDVKLGAFNHDDSVKLVGGEVFVMRVQKQGFPFHAGHELFAGDFLRQVCDVDESLGYLQVALGCFVVVDEYHQLLEVLFALLDYQGLRLRLFTIFVQVLLALILCLDFSESDIVCTFHVNIVLLEPCAL